MRYLVVGSGGREHAIYWRLLADHSASQVYVMPGNGGIDKKDRVDINPKDHKAVIGFCKKNNIDVVVIGPEAPLVDGLGDSLKEAGIKTFGPSAKAAQLEGSKLFAKKIMEKYNVPTAEHVDLSGKKELLEYIDKVEKYPIVIKLDGLAAGKGVSIPENKDEAIEFIENYVKEDSNVFVEEFLVGEEASVFGISDGEHIYPLVTAQDHKRIFDGDKGPNTGGMGAYAPTPVLSAEVLERVKKEVLEPVVNGMKKEGIPFKGVLFAGIMIDPDNDIKVLEFNVRFGDPEAQVVLPLLEGKLGDLILASIDGNLEPDHCKCQTRHAMTVVMSSGGYPGKYEVDKEIFGLDKFDVKQGIFIFHGGTKEENDKYYTAGGRVLDVTAIDDDFGAVKEKVYDAVTKISFENAFFRKDIGHHALNFIEKK